MVDIKKIVITKKLYHFEVKKRFQQIKHFKVIKKSPSELIIQNIKGIFKPRVQEVKKSSMPVMATEAIQKPKGGFNKWVLFGALSLAILLLVAGWLYISVKIAAETPEVVVPVSVTPEFSSVLQDSSIVSAGEIRTGENIAYVRMRHTFKGISNFTVTLSVYEDQLPQKIYILSSDRTQADGYEDFIDEFRSNLSSRNIQLNLVSFQELGNLPSNALLIIPSGRPPQQLLSPNTTSNIFTLLGRGIDVVYIGQPFNRVIDDQGLVIPTSDNILKKMSFTFDETIEIKSEQDFHLYQPLYSVKSSDISMFQEQFQVYGSISVLKSKFGSTLLFLPQTLDGGWLDISRNRDPRLAARDLARIIYDTPWSTRMGQPNVYTKIIGNDSEVIADYFTSTFKPADNASIKIEIKANGENSTLQDFEIVQTERKVKGDLFVDGGYTVIPNEISLQLTLMNAILRGNSSDQKFLSLVVTSKGKILSDSFPIGSGPTSLQSEFSIGGVPLHLDSGEYIATILDEENVAHASTYLKVVFLDPVEQEQTKKAVYPFLIQRDGQPYIVREIQVSVDKGKFGVYTFKDVDALAVDVSNFTNGENLAPGLHTFDFKVGTITKSIPFNILVQKGGIFSDPLFIGTILFAFIIIGVGVYFARKEEVSFQLDIPDFPPITKTKIALNTETIISLFEKINQDYKWTFTPLTTYEIKNGFRNIFHKGKAIYITDYNVEFVLDQLVAKGSVKEELGYYGVSAWELKSKKSMEYLSMFRKIRDICVNNATPFTSMGESENCDTTITSVGQDMFIHIYDQKGDMVKMVTNALKSVTKGISIVLFEDESKKDGFQQYLSSTSLSMLALKLEVDSGSVLLLTTNELEKMLKELKAV
ncbi:MAG: hypothetical protein Q7S22_02440 [Candidatus Micrarchaeota archaeon]|nr:hypothetical protein [Candidatus Micrarchaeota archaeon]